MLLHFQIFDAESLEVDAILFIYSDKKSFEWLASKVSKSEAGIKFLIGNKSDLASKEIDLETAQDYA